MLTIIAQTISTLISLVSISIIVNVLVPLLSLSAIILLSIIIWFRRSSTTAEMLAA